MAWAHRSGGILFIFPSAPAHTSPFEFRAHARDYFANYLNVVARLFSRPVLAALASNRITRQTWEQYGVVAATTANHLDSHREDPR